jgi:hypothetical protein
MSEREDPKYIYTKDGRRILARSNPRRSSDDRASLAECLIVRVLRTYTVASMRTLENKMSDGGPLYMRVDPHVAELSIVAIPPDRSTQPMGHTTGGEFISLSC